MTSQSYDELHPVSTGSYVVGAIVGVVGGGFAATVLYLMFGGVVVGFLGFGGPADRFDLGTVPHLIFAAVGAVIGVAANLRTVARSARRQAALAGTAASLGFTDATDQAGPIGTKIRSLMGLVQKFELHAPRSRTAGETRMTLCEIGWCRTSHESQEENTNYRRTALLLEIPGLELPPLVVKPDAWLLVAPLSAARVEPLKLADRPEFSTIYQVSADDPSAARRVLTADVTDFLAAHPGLELLADGSTLAVFRSGGLVPAEEIADFVEIATGVARVLVRAASLPESALPPVSAGDAETVSPDRSRAARRVERQRRSGETLRALLDQPPPRHVPARFVLRQVGCFGVMLVFIGVWFVIVGTGLVWQTVAGGAAGGEVLFAALFPLTGATLLLYAARYRHRLLRRLRHGEARTATVTAVAPTGTIAAGGRRYQLTLQLQDGDRRTISVTADGTAAERAERLRASGGTTRVLLDPYNPDRAQWLDGGD